MLSVNRAAYKLVEKLCDNAEEYKIIVSKTKSGAAIIDGGMQAKGGFSAGALITEICMGGMGKAEIFLQQFHGLELPTIHIQTDHPAIAALGSQVARWPMKSGDFSAIGSGPARALALKPREIYDEIGYRDESDVAVLVLETSKKPPEEIISSIASECKVKPTNLYIILTPTNSIVGSVQISGRIVETGMHKLRKLGLDPNMIEFASGYAPVASVHPKFADAMGRTNDVILYGGVVYFALHHTNDDYLREVIDKAPSKASQQYGKPFKEIFKEAKNDFYNIDPNLFAPAMLVVNNLSTGTVFSVGEIDIEVLRRSIGLATR